MDILYKLLQVFDLFSLCMPRQHVDIVALAGVAQWTEHQLVTKRLLVQFPIRAHGWVAGKVPGMGGVRGNPISLTHRCFSPFLSPSFPISLK